MILMGKVERAKNIINFYILLILKTMVTSNIDIS